MKNDFNWKVLDHRWFNLKRWAEAMAKREDRPVMLVQSMLDMIEICEKMDNKRDELFLEMIEKIMKEENGKPTK